MACFFFKVTATTGIYTYGHTRSLTDPLPILTGGAGNDILIGDGDVMKDGARGGADTLEGGDGDDWLYGDGREQATAGAGGADKLYGGDGPRSEEHTSELQSLMRQSYAVFCLNKKTHTT